MGREKAAIKDYEPGMENFKEYVFQLAKCKSVKEDRRFSTSIYNAVQPSRITHHIPVPEAMEFLILAGDNGDFSTLEKFCLENSKLLFYYWDILYPEKPQKSMLGILFRSLTQDSNLSRKELAAALDTSTSKLCYILNGKTRVSYNTFVKLAEFLNISEFEFLDKLANMDGKESIKLFTNTVNEARMRKGLSVEYAADTLGISPDDYIKLENGEIMVTKKQLKIITAMFGLDFIHLGNTAVIAHLITRRDFEEPNRTAYEQRIKSSDKVQPGNIVPFLASLSLTNYVTDGKKYVPSKIISSIVMMCLMDSEKWQFIRDEMYYIGLIDKRASYMTDEQLKSLPPYYTPLLDGTLSADASYNELLTFYREKMGMSVADIGKLDLKVSKTQLYDILKRDGYISNLPLLYNTHKVIGCPFAAGIDLYLKSYTEKKSAKLSPLTVGSEISLVTINQIIESNHTWDFLGNEIPHEDLKIVFSVLLSSKPKAEKFRVIANIGLPVPAFLKDKFFGTEKSLQ